MLSAGLGGYGGYDSPEGLADAHGMGYGDNEGGMGGGYNSFMRGLLDAYAKLYGGNSSLLGKNWGPEANLIDPSKVSVFGGPLANPQDNLFAEYTDLPMIRGLSERDRIGTMDARHYPTVMGGYPRGAGQAGPYPMGGMPMGSQVTGWTPGVNGTYNPGVWDTGDSEGGGELPYIRPRRLAYRNAYDQWDEQGGFGGGM